MTSYKPNEALKASKLFDVSNFTAIVTGGATGIGLMITETLASNGAKVYITGRRKEKLDNVVRRYSGDSGRIVALPGDVSNKEDVIRIAKEVESKEPNGIQLLVNNAGILRDNVPGAAGAKDSSELVSGQKISEYMMKSDPDGWTETFQTNVTALYFVSAAFLPLLEMGHNAAPGFTSSVVNISSVSGVIKTSGGGQFAYAASKAAALQLTRSLASTFLPTKVRVNCIAPAVFPSEMTGSAAGEDGKTTVVHRDKSRYPAGRFGKDTDMGACLLMLAGPGGTWLNGHVLYPDGGILLTSPSMV